ncbi:MAG: hypothetical protein NT038_08455 [Euryarchaeota archaeon]|nr:hypothetical protein [Euryarchaeota archaeon]
MKKTNIAYAIVLLLMPIPVVSAIGQNKTRTKINEIQLHKIKSSNVEPSGKIFLLIFYVLGFIAVFLHCFVLGTIKAVIEKILITI